MAFGPEWYYFPQCYSSFPSVTIGSERETFTCMHPQYYPSFPSAANRRERETIKFLPIQPVEKDLLGRVGCPSSCTHHSGFGAGDVDLTLRLGPPQVVPPPVEAAARQARAIYSGTLLRLAPPFLQVPSLPPAPPAEFCSMCSTTETPLWRRGPNGPKSLCNACGIRYKKEERRLALSLGKP